MTDGTLDRESLRARLALWSDVQRRIATERLVDRLPDALLVEILDGLVHLHEHRTARPGSTASLLERVDAHVLATRRRSFLGEYELRNRHGQREPWQTQAWIAATSHLFALALARAEDRSDLESRASLVLLVSLVEEVDEHVDKFVVFEDSSARDHFGHEVQRARTCVAQFESIAEGEP